MLTTTFGHNFGSTKLQAGWSGGQSGGAGLQTGLSGGPPEESAPRRKTNLYIGSLSAEISGLGPDGSSWKPAGPFCIIYNHFDVRNVERRNVVACKKLKSTRV
jgi:hypothetical protein